MGYSFSRSFTCSFLAIVSIWIFLLPGHHSFAKGNPLSLSGSISGETKVWHKITITFDGPFAAESNSLNPFMDYRLNVLFTHADTSYLVPGYFAADGNAAETGATAGSKWRVHFSPDRTGPWTYTASFRQGTEVAISMSETAGTALSFDGATGSFFVSPTDKSKPDLRAKGRLAYVGKHYRQHQGSGEYFIKLGTDSPENFLNYEGFDNTPNIDNLRKSWSPHLQDWQTGDPTWQGGKGKGIIGALNYLSSKGINAFSFLTLGHLGDDQNIFPWVDASDPMVYDISKLDQWEIVMEHADHKGLFMHIKTTERENAAYLDNGDLGPERKLYHRELIARFGHHLALNWNVGEENNQGKISQQAYAQHFHDLDPYRHLVVMHTASSQLDLYFTPLLGDSSKLTGASINASRLEVHRTVEKWAALSSQSGKPWVLSNDEQNPPQRGILPDDGYMGHDGTTTPTLDNTRQEVIWGTLMAGGSGALYYYGYNYAESDLTLQDFRSRDRLFTHSKYALDFFRKYVPFQEMSNLDSLIGNPLHDVGDYCFGKMGEAYVVYLESVGQNDFILPGDTAEYTIQWYNPRTGGGLQNGSVTRVQAPATVNLGFAPDSSSDDWVVLIKKAEPFVTQQFQAFCISDSSVAQKVDSFLSTLGLNDPYYPSPYSQGNCEETSTPCTGFDVNAGPDLVLTCSDSAQTLVATSTAGSPTYIWSSLSGNITSGSQTSTAVVNQIGEYLVSVVDSSGCSATDTVKVTSSQGLFVDAGPDQSLSCITGSAVLDGSASDAGTFTWTGPNGFGSGAIMPAVSDSGVYYLTVTSPLGCTGTDSVFVSGNDSIPTAMAGQDQILNCNITSVVLDGTQSSAGTYAWTGPNGFTSSNVAPSVSETGKYVLTVTNTSGCAASDSLNVFGDYSGEYTDAGPDQVLGCAVTTVTLDASASDPGTYSWTGPNNFTSSLTQITVSEPGVYILYNIGTNGCIATDTAIVTETSTTSVVNAGPDKTLSCTITTVTLDGTANGSGTYNWTGPNGFISNASSPQVSAAGTYVLGYTNLNGCTGYDSVLVDEDLSAPIVEAGSEAKLDCNVTAITLDGSASDPGAASWTGPAGFTSTSLTPTVTNQGLYLLTITAANGCLGSDSVEVVLDATLPLTDAGPADTLTCDGIPVVLDGSNSGPGIYAWTGPNGFSSSMVQPTITVPGTYTLTVTDPSGCTGTDFVVISEDLSKPFADAGPAQVLTCDQSFVTLDGSASDPGTYFWLGPNGFSANGISPMATETGTYVLVITGVNGCINEDSVSVTGDFATPIANAGSVQELNCDNPIITLDGSASDPGIYSWNGPNGYSSTAQAPQVHIPGTYTLTVIGLNGCTASDDVQVTENFTLPVADAGPDQIIDCGSGTTVLDGSFSGPGTYSWTGPNGFSSSSLSPTVTNSGAYVLTVTAANGCEASDVMMVTEDCNTPCNGNAISHFYLVDADADVIVQDPLADGSIVDIALLGNDLNIGAIVVECGVEIESVDFTLSGPVSHNQTENLALWVLFGNSGNDFNSWNPPTGTYTLTATPFSANNANGDPGTPLTITFTVINSSSSAASPTTEGNNNSSAPQGYQPTSGSIKGLSAPQMMLFPNPFSEKKLSVALSGTWEPILHLQLYNNSGQLIHEEERQFGSSFQIDLSAINLAEGAYRLRINDESRLIEYVNNSP